MHQHAIACFGDDDAAGTVEYALSNRDLPAHGERVHKAAINGAVSEPWFVDTPFAQLMFEVILGADVAIMALRRPRVDVNNVSTFHRNVAVIGFCH